MAGTIVFVVGSLLVSACTAAQTGSTQQRLDNYYQGKSDKAFFATDGQFRSVFPAVPTRDTQKSTGAGADITITYTTYTSGFSGTAFSVAFADFPPGTPIDLNGAVNGFAVATNGKVVSSKFVTFQGFPAVEFVLAVVQNGPKFFKTTVFLKGQRSYDISVLGPDNPPKGYDKFLSAFALAS